MDAGEYCRAVESYLCRRNDGHLIRIVGPAFEMVCAWAEAGIPLSIVRRGIDQRFSRYYASGPRRHPLRIDFCEADILTLFDDWKRAVHISGAALAADAASAEPRALDAGAQGAGATRRRQHSLGAHLDRVETALANWTPPASNVNPELDQAIAGARNEVDQARADAGTRRGAARQSLIERLAALDQALVGAARQGTDAATRARLRSEATDSLAPFRERMLPGAFATAIDTATDHLLADHWRLPRLTYD